MFLTSLYSHFSVTYILIALHYHYNKTASQSFLEIIETEQIALSLATRMVKLKQEDQLSQS